MAVQIKRRRLINPHKRKTTLKRSTRRAARAGAKRAHRSKSRKNPTLYTLGFLNPNGGTMKKHTKRHARRKTARRHRNPMQASAPKRRLFRRGRRHRNPRASTMLSKPVGIAKMTLIAGGSMLLTRQLPQLLLGAKNTGWMGYLANVGTTIGAAMVARAAAGKEAAFSAAIGGTLYLFVRVLTEKFSPLGPYLALSGVGDVTAAKSLGRLVPGYYPVPVKYDSNGQPVIPQAILDATRPAPEPAGVGRLAARF